MICPSLRWKVVVEVAGRAGGSRRSHDASPRRRKVTVRFNEDEFALVSQRAEALGLSVATYLASRGVEPVSPPKPGVAVSRTQMRSLTAELYAIKRLLTLSASNLNQLARLANATGEVRPQALHYAQHLVRTVPRLEAFVEGLRGWVEPRRSR